ncbi:hypothetical protein [Xanthomonas hortorum]|uniref:hypothetical protein n=3 Tax=Xanthomonas hortorum TaxID=56454 RepID=UPI001F221B30|nr:hypothetical protein [Xanthomonas hortorum]MCE4365024.1 hypothetical protein [Xanthomonas hortorum]
MKKIALITGIILVVITAIFLYGGKNEYKSITVPLTVDAHKNLSQQGAEVDVGGSAQSKIREKFTPNSLYVGELKGKDQRLIALSALEAEWLEKHHFPTQSEIDNILNIPLTALTKEKDFFNPKIQTLYGLRLLKEGRTEDAVAVLQKAADRGSIYAREQLAIAQSQLLAKRMGDSASISGDNLAIVVAGVETAKILGDHRAYSAIASHPAAKINRQEYGNAIQLQVTEFLRQAGASAQLTGVRPPGPDPRPNAEQWGKIDAGQQSPDIPITVYDRKNVIN